MSNNDARPPRPIPKAIAVLLSLAVVPLVIAAVLYFFGDRQESVKMSILLPGLLLNVALAYLSRPRGEKLLVVPWFVVLMFVTALGIVLYLFILLATHKGDLKIGG